MDEKRITGVARFEAAVQLTHEKVREQLKAIEDARGSVETAVMATKKIVEFVNGMFLLSKQLLQSKSAWTLPSESGVADWSKEIVVPLVRLGQNKTAREIIEERLIEFGYLPKDEHQRPEWAREKRA